ncbi:MAG TPA: hypothetical protein VEU55_07880 [Gemmatimonadales bacterium]|nr:hypothetical protein [Gemmatimonadales bacterium]
MPLIGDTILVVMLSDFIPLLRRSADWQSFALRTAGMGARGGVRAPAGRLLPPAASGTSTGPPGAPPPA